jgi:iron complex outermembrane receptor protein
MFNKRSLPASLYLFSPLTISIAAGLTPAYGEEPIDIIEIHSQKITNSEFLDSAEQLLREQGVDFSAAGGMSGLPVLNAMMGDRIKVLIDGAEITSACANQMDPPLSYISANQIQSLNVLAGISPLGLAGDNAVHTFTSVNAALASPALIPKT